jgi:hypothetical protein
MGAGVLVGLSWALPLLWAILIVVRLGDIRKLLGKIADDISALRNATEDRSPLQ